ncbi:type 1 glutamine amidotransferase family protein [Erysipelothrix aquatica]|uniref:type 1 glutamine amidotransferase family protein n=1 Tax=Erysipelothrix aquatica TaxID=2683714 RepID=UPI00135C4C92|nr:type 1 glutamine amidotransferase family protein [Erysipelothrix aquatica]
MKQIYIYVMDTLADWEIGYITAELHSRRFFKDNAPDITIHTVSYTSQTITTMGGLKVTPDCTLERITVNEDAVLILPGADTWQQPEHQAVLRYAQQILNANGTVAAICGATLALASSDMLNTRNHTSNGPGFLDMFSPNYTGQSFYQDQPVVRDNNLITAGSTDALRWSKAILETLDVFRDDTLALWYTFFSEGNPNTFYALMETLPSKGH